MQYRPVWRSHSNAMHSLSDIQRDYQPPRALIDNGCLLCCDSFLLVEDFLTKPHAERLVRHCLSGVAWKREKVRLFGREYESPRLISSYGDCGVSYTYGGSTNHALPWTGTLEACRSWLVEQLAIPLNFVLLNRYRSGADYVGWHADNERCLGPLPIIASLSLGETRKFLIRLRRGGASQSINLPNASLLLMWGRSQQLYQHTLARSSKPIGERINLTFRYVEN